MKIPILHGPRDLRVEDQELDTSNLKPHEVWVKTEISAFKIGTDRGNYEGAEDVPGAPTYPRPVGDSNLGVGRGVGSDVTRLKPGDRVAGQTWHCSEYVADEREIAMVKVPERVHSEDAVYTYLYTLSAHCYHKAMFRPGENVAVVGLGTLGMGAIGVGRLFGARVVGIGNSELRMEMAERMGTHACFLSGDPDLHAKLDEFTDGAGIDLVILTANPWPAYLTSVEIVRPGGRVSIVSLPERGEKPLDFNPLHMKWFYDKGISLIAVSHPGGYLFPSAQEERFTRLRNAAHTLSLMEDGGLEPKRLITHRLHYTEMQQAYEMAFNREKSMLGVTFQWKD